MIYPCRPERRRTRHFTPERRPRRAGHGDKPQPTRPGRHSTTPAVRRDSAAALAGDTGDRRTQLGAGRRRHGRTCRDCCDSGPAPSPLTPPTSADLCRPQLTSADLCRPQLTSADLCRPADPCRPPPTSDSRRRRPDHAADRPDCVSVGRFRSVPPSSSGVRARRPALGALGVIGTARRRHCPSRSPPPSPPRGPWGA